nr:LOW QUALITY PROTEIN: uncharacterized protein K02A2.6-like [Paramormyrops kingsleyae]
MATFGTVGEFVEGDEDWTEYEERLGHFFDANGIREEDEAKKRSILLSVCGAKTYKLIRNLATPRKPGEVPYKELVQLVSNHHNPKPSVIVQRFKFHSRFRKSGQSVANFVAELRQLSEHCDFGAVLDDMLRDRLVCGVNDDAIQRRLLGETPPLTFKKAFEISQGMETAASNAKDIQKGHSSSHTVPVHQLKKDIAKSSRRVECFRCGGAHYANVCKFKDSICHGCNKRGHLVKKCNSTGNKAKIERGKAQQAPADTHHVAEASEEAMCAFNMFGVEMDEDPPMPYYTTVAVNGRNIKFEIDSGATASVISEDTYKKTWGSKQPPLCPSKLKLRTYTGQPIPLLGVLQVVIAAGSQSAEGRLVVVKGTGPSLLGRADTHHVAEASEEAMCAFNMFGVEMDEDPPMPYYTTVAVNGRNIKFEIDSGATASVISEDTYKKTWGSKQPPLCPSKLKLRTYTGQPIPLLGVLQVVIAAGSQSAEGRLVVVKGTGPSLLGRDWLQKIKLKWHEIKYVHTTEDILQRFREVFRDELGTLKGVSVKLHVDPNATPRFYKPRTVPYAMKGKVEEELERLQALGIIEPVLFSRWAAPIVPVMKPDKTVRICGDYKLTVNQVAKLEEYPLPRVDDLFATLAGGKMFTKLDMSHAYQQLLLDEKSKEYVTINTHKGLFKYNRLVFGVASSPAIFQRTMDTLLQGIPQVAAYLDDILITGTTEVEHLSNLEQVLKRIAKAGLRLKCDKCVFMAPSVTYLGHKISAEGLCPVEEKVRAIKEAPSPKNITELRSFLGMVNYYGKFLQDLSTVLKPLYTLLQHDTKWQWYEEQEKAFKEVKELLQSAKLLVHYDPNKEITLSCDASPYGLGAVLSHVMKDGSEKPIGFASRTLTAAEKGYSQLDKEGLAIVFAVKRFHQYLYGRVFKIHTDHKPLMSLFGETRCIPPLASARIQRWALILSAYQYTIEYRAGKDNGNADALSRLPLPETPAFTHVPPETVFSLEKLSETPVKASQVRLWTERDLVLSKVKTFLLQGWPKIVQSEELRPYMKRKAELSLQDGCIFWGTRVVVPPQGRAQVLEEIHETHPGVSRMKSLARSYVWWPKMDLDLENKVKFCSQCQSNQKITDNGPTFTSELFSEFMDQNGIRHIRTAPFHPASNGLAERAVQTVKEGLKRMTGDSLSARLSRFLFKYCLTPQTTTASTPAEMLMGRRPKSRLDLLRPDMKEKVGRKQEKQKEGHDLQARERLLKPGDNVYVRNFSSHPKQPWLPGVILMQNGPVSFVIKLTDGRVFRRHQDHVRLRYDKGTGSVNEEEFPLGATEGACSPEEALSEKVSVSPAVQAQELLDAMTPLVAAATDLPKAPFPVVITASEETVRRSQRVRKPPDRLNI